MRTVLVVAVAATTALACGTDTQTPFAVDAEFSRKPSVSNPATSWHIPLDDAGLALRSDGEHATNGSSVYADGVCNVASVIQLVSGSGDATIQLNQGKGGKGCLGRTMVLRYPDGVTEQVRTFNNVRGLQLPQIEIGTTELRTFAIHPGALGVSSRCGRLLFGVGAQGAGGDSDRVSVTRIDPRTWRVQSQIGGQALCEGNGAYYDMPIDFVIQTDTALP